MEMIGFPIIEVVFQFSQFNLDRISNYSDVLISTIQLFKYRDYSIFD